MVIKQADMKDFEGIVALHKGYHTDFITDEDRSDGFVTTNFTPEQLEDLIVKEHGVTVAKDENGKIVAYAIAASWEFWVQWPLFTYMIERLPEYSLKGQELSTENSYQYGPVCVEKSLRGTGVFEQVFYASLSSMHEHYSYMVTFINQINPRSFAAHTNKVHMTKAGTFKFNNNNYYLMACSTNQNNIKHE